MVHITDVPFGLKLDRYDRVMLEITINYLNKHNILYENQSGFRQKHCTYMALLETMDHVSDVLGKRNATVEVFIDLSKAFDSFNHNIILSKLYHYGIRGLTYDWFYNYLSNRLMYAGVRGVCSDMLPRVCGVPQGSILGPLLFLLYVNDLPVCYRLLKCIIIADDTNIFYSNNNTDFKLLHLSDLLKFNTFSLNIKKQSLFLVNTEIVIITLELML